jgi:dihydroneopterin aldolase
MTMISSISVNPDFFCIAGVVCSVIGCLAVAPGPQRVTGRTTRLKILPKSKSKFNPFGTKKVKKSFIDANPAGEAIPEDRVALLGMVLRTTIGFNPEERTAPRDLEADVRLAVDLRAAGRSDDLADTVDYAALAERLSAVAAASSFRLLEALAEALAAEALADPRVAAAEIALRKPGAVPGALAEVRVVRRRGR